MKKAGWSWILLFLSAMIVSCTPVQYSAKDEAFMQNTERKLWKKVAILPFTGDPAFRRVSAEWLAFLVRKHGLFEIIGPAIAEIELKEKGIPVEETEVPVEKACAAGRALGVDAVIVGSLKLQGYPGGIGQWPVAGVSLLDVSTGRVLATSIQRSKAFFSNDRQMFAISAVENVVDDIASVLYAAAGRPWTPPKSEERPADGTGGTPW